MRAQEEVGVLVEGESEALKRNLGEGTDSQFRLDLSILNC